MELLASRSTRSGGLYDQKVHMTSPITVPRTNMLALIGFIAAFVMPVAGIILGVFALRQLRIPGNTEPGAGLARWALVIGVIGTVLTALFFIVWVTLFLSAWTGQPLSR